MDRNFLERKMGGEVSLKSKPRTDAGDSFFTGLKGNEKSKGKAVYLSKSRFS